MTDQLCAAIRAARQAAGVTQAELAARLGVAQPHVSRWERHVRPSVGRLAQIERALDIPVGTLMRAACDDESDDE